MAAHVNCEVKEFECCILCPSFIAYYGLLGNEKYLLLDFKTDHHKNWSPFRWNCPKYPLQDEKLPDTAICGYETLKAVPCGAVAAYASQPGAYASRNVKIQHESSSDKRGDFAKIIQSNHFTGQNSHPAMLDSKGSCRMRFGPVFWQESPKPWNYAKWDANLSNCSHFTHTAHQGGNIAT